MKTRTYQQALNEQLKDPAFREEFEQIDEEFTLAKEIIELRIKHELTQKQLADLVGTSQPAIARLESGSYRNVSLSFLRRVAKALDAVPEVHLKPQP